mmetsp:Transcript_21438/g.65476  ORF Transcript_21438/g.65476 Transcript_21438/m.65476 type:complete len:187 (+) Transcript_21438:838-1398(+)
MQALMASNLRRLRALPAISVAVIDGAARGGGAELSVSTDLRVWSHAGSVAFVHNNMGLGMPGWGALHRLIHVCGRQVALRLLAFGETVHLDEAKALGLVDCVVGGSDASHSSVEKNLAETLKRITSPPFRGSMLASKTAVNYVGMDQEEAEKREARIFATRWGKGDNATAVAAILERGRQNAQQDP